MKSRDLPDTILSIKRNFITIFTGFVLAICIFFSTLYILNLFPYNTITLLIVMVIFTGSLLTFIVCYKEYNYMVVIIYITLLNIILCLFIIVEYFFYDKSPGHDSNYFVFFYLLIPPIIGGFLIKPYYTFIVTGFNIAFMIIFYYTYRLLCLPEDESTLIIKISIIRSGALQFVMSIICYYFSSQFTLILNRLKTSENNYKTMFNVAGEGIMIADLETKKILFSNPAISELTGYTNKELSQLTVFDIHPKQAYDKIIKDFEQVANKGKDVPFIKKDGSLIFMDISASRITIEGKECNIGFFTDVTRQKQAMDSLKISEERFRTFMETAGDMMFVIDRFNRFTYINTAMTKSLGYTKQEMLDKRIDMIFDIPSLENFNENLTELISQQQITQETTFITKKNEKICGELTATAMINHLSQYTGARIVFHDITKHKKIEEDLKIAGEKAAEANKTKTLFFANMSHELRTPLNAIIGFIQLLKSREAGNLTQHQKEYLKYINESALFLLTLVNDILDITKIEKGKIDIIKAPFNITTMIHKLCKNIKPLISSKHLNLQINIADDIDYLNGDELRIQQVILNLLSNAVKFTPENKNIGITAYYNDDTIIIKIWDEGIGIAEHNIPKIFKPFEQVINEHSRTEKGTGLGLAISKEIINLHNGTIDVESHLNIGTSFIITLPGKINKKNITSLKTELYEVIINPPKTTKHILLVEDNEINMKLIENFLKFKGFNLYWAQTGEEAVELFKNNTYDLILMDMELSGINGAETMQQIRQLDETSIPIVILTAFAMKEDRQKFITMGFNEYIAKPINVNLLLSTISNLLQLDFEIIKIEEDTIESETIIDYNALLKNFNNDISMVHEILTVFLHQLEDQIPDIEKHLQTKNMKKLHKISHNLKGSALNLTANDIASVAMKLDKITNGEYVANQDSIIMELKNLYDQLKSYISTLDQ